MVLLALRRYDESQHVYTKHAPISFPPKQRLLKHVHDRLGTLDAPGFAPGKVFGIGLSKTGTTSLTAALERLGYATIHWQNPLTGDLISEDDLDLFDAFTDITVSFAFERFWDRCPDGRFIYTTRPVDDWVQSITDHFGRAYGTSGLEDFRELVSESRLYGGRYAEIHESLYCCHADSASAYRAYDERVRSFFRAIAAISCWSWTSQAVTRGKSCAASWTGPFRPSPFHG